VVGAEHVAEVNSHGQRWVDPAEVPRHVSAGIGTAGGSPIVRSYVQWNRWGAGYVYTDMRNIAAIDADLRMIAIVGVGQREFGAVDSTTALDQLLDERNSFGGRRHLDGTSGGLIAWIWASQVCDHERCGAPTEPLPGHERDGPPARHAPEARSVPRFRQWVPQSQ